jgi:hypothetical protein
MKKLVCAQPDCVAVRARRDHLVLVRDDVAFVDGLAGRSEIATLTVVECDGVGRIVRITVFDVEDEDLAYAAFDARAAELDDQ